jgi:nucleotide-binding universal stress UspA family protein
MLARRELPLEPTAVKVKRIVCGVDFSPMSVAAFLTAADLARSMDAELHVLHVIEAYPPTASWPRDGERQDVQSLQQKATSAMEALVTRSAVALDSVSVTTEITVGLAFAELLNRVRDATRDLIVVGATGVKLFEDALFGGTADQVVKGAPCSVLVVRADQPTDR